MSDSELTWESPPLKAHERLCHGKTRIHPNLAPPHQFAEFNSVSADRFGNVCLFYCVSRYVVAAAFGLAFGGCFGVWAMACFLHSALRW